MENTIKSLLVQTNELKSALLLECSEEEAAQYGTMKEWKKINRLISSLERKFRKIVRTMRVVSADLLRSQEIFDFCCHMIFLLLISTVVKLAVISLAVFLFTSSIGIPFSSMMVSSIWLIYELFKLAIGGMKWKRK